MVVLGVCDSQDSGACLFLDGRLVAAVNEERLNRRKLWGGVPLQSIAECLRLGGVAAKDVEAVIVGTQATPNVIARAFRDVHQPLRRWNGQFRYVLNAFITYQTLARQLRVPLAMEAAVARAILAKDLRAAGIRARVATVDHHLAHAAAAWATSPFDRALVVTVDGLGDGLSVTVSVGERGKGLKRIHEETGFSALTLYYSRLTEFLGFTAIKDEGKVNALAAYTDRFPVMDIVRKLLSCKDGRLSIKNHVLPESRDAWPWSELAKFSREEVAACFQRNLEDVMKEYVRYWMVRTGMRNLAVAGGLFANVKLNQRLASMDELDGIYIYPHMGDGGLAVGGCLAWMGSEPAVLDNVFLGPSFDEDEVRAALQETQATARRCDDIELETARLLAGGKVVARHWGRMEYGPRALGNRSILVQATDPTTIDWLNVRLKRSPFMPFAPAMLDEEYDECVVGGHKGRHAAQFMTIAYDVTPRMRKECPGAVHVDDTARPQRVTDEANPGFAKILRIYKDLTGLPSVINTSFNMHEEPIVCTPRDAVLAFRKSGLDALTVGPFLVERDAPNPP